MTAAGTSAFAASRSCTVVPVIVLASIGSLNETTTLAPTATPEAPFAGAIALTTGSVVSGPASVAKTTSTQ